ncbi:MAG: ATP-binding cassette domain-containing protein [Clostridium sp.]|nr:MAG: ATP-binding cassette domain-containing protein [Clostridium sp.]
MAVVKSTLLKIIAKDTKYQGKVLFNNKEIAKNDICYVASDQNAIMEATLFENFMALRKKSNIEKNKQMEYFYGLMALFNLPKELVHMEYKALSTGQRKQIYICIKLIFLNKKNLFI